MEAIEVFVASLIVAATASILFATVIRLAGVWQAGVLVFIFAFATSAWSTASRALWQHPDRDLRVERSLGQSAADRRRLAWRADVIVTAALLAGSRPWVRCSASSGSERVDRHQACSCEGRLRGARR